MQWLIHRPALPTCCRIPPSPNSKHAACGAKMALLLDQDKTSIASVCGWFEGQNVFFEESGTGNACRELTKWRDTGRKSHDGQPPRNGARDKERIPRSRAVSTAKHRSAVLVSHSKLLYDTVLFPAICTLESHLFSAHRCGKSSSPRVSSYYNTPGQQTQLMGRRAEPFISNFPWRILPRASVSFGQY